MKRRTFLLLVLCLALITAVTGCAGTEQTASRVPTGSGSVEDVLKTQMAKADGLDQADVTESQDTAVRQSGVNDNAPLPQVYADENTVLSTTEGIDIDLTVLSSTMVYSEVYNMMTAPADYLGKTIKMSGFFSVQHNSTTDQYYFACIIKDAASCCAQGIEFSLAGDSVYPEDYPAQGSMIDVVGVFDTYVENSYVYCTLRDASFV